RCVTGQNPTHRSVSSGQLLRRFRMLTVILLAIAAFAATNIDNLFVLLAFLAESHEKWDVVAGQYLGSLALVVLACGLASLMLGVPAGYVGLVGVMPVLIGIGKLLQ